jgi:uncharacterized repeat protein (TIGR04138 family)
MWDNTKATFWKRIAASTGVPPEGLSFIYDACEFTQTCQISGRLVHFSAVDYCRCFVELARTKLGADYAAALTSWNLDTSEKLGQAFYALIELGFMRQQKDDCLSEFAGQFSFADPSSQQALHPAYTYPLTGLPDYQHYLRIPIINRLVSRGVMLIGLTCAVSVVLWALSFVDPALQIPAAIILALLIPTMTGLHVKFPRQFSLQTLLLAVTIICIVLGLMAYLFR